VEAYVEPEQHRERYLLLDQCLTGKQAG
jgi:hypothetical protein